MVKLVTEKIKCQKIDKFYFRDHAGRIRKYLKYCRRLKCKTESSYNYENIKNQNIVSNIKKLIW